MCGSMADIQSAAAEIRRGKEEEKRTKKNKPQHENIMVCALFHRVTIIIILHASASPFSMHVLLGLFYCSSLWRAAFGIGQGVAYGRQRLSSLGPAIKSTRLLRAPFHFVHTAAVL